MNKKFFLIFKKILNLIFFKLNFLNQFLNFNHHVRKTSQNLSHL